MDIDSLLIDLEVIGQLRGSDKLAVEMLPGSSRLYINSSSYSQSIRRWWTGSNRNACMDYVTALIEKCSKAVDVIEEGKHVSKANQLLIALQKAIEGINMLNTTYSSDSVLIAGLVITSGKIGTLIDRLTSIKEPLTT